MGQLRLVEQFLNRLIEVRGLSDLFEALAATARDMDFRHFALSHHVNLPDQASAVFIHDYPDAWADEYVGKGLGGSDPIHRASQRSIAGFAWRELTRRVILTDADRRMLERGRAHGLGDGFTVPANVPGEMSGSCTFAVGPGEALPGNQLLVAQLVGTFAFESARRLQAGPVSEERSKLTERQRDCVLWVARGKSDWEISRILGLSQETVVQHVKVARERYDVEKRTPLVVRALFDGLFSFAEIIGRRR